MIKFRVWDDETQKYRTDCRLKDVFGAVTGNPATVFVDTANTAGAVEQYTGFKDKNGKEIYEGDIVKIAQTLDNWTPETSPIKFDDDLLAYIVEDSRDCRMMSDFSEDMFEIIGNIHENPELLEEER